MGIVKFFILRWILALTIEKADFCFEPLDKLVLLLQLRLAHYLFKWEIQRAQTGYVWNVNVQETFKWGPHANIGSLTHVMVQNFFQAAPQDFEHTFRNKNAVSVLEKTEPSLNIDLHVDYFIRKKAVELSLFTDVG